MSLKVSLSLRSRPMGTAPQRKDRHPGDRGGTELPGEGGMRASKTAILVEAVLTAILLVAAALR